MLKSKHYRGLVMFGLLDLGLIGFILLILLILLLPLIATIIVGVALANILGFTGITWWAFVILFYFVIGAILGSLGA